MSMVNLFGIFLAIAVLMASGLPGTSPPAGDTMDHLTGTWRAVLESPGGSLPFSLRINPPGSEPPAVALNGDEEVPFSHLDVHADSGETRITLRTDWYDSKITATLSPAGTRLEGEWQRPYPGRVSSLPFTATNHDARRFLPDCSIIASGDEQNVDGDWIVEFIDESGASPARAEFQQHGRGVVGTFLTPTGDYRYLEGMFEHGRLRLSCFDGAHVFLFDARLGADGRLIGDFWSRDTYHATWTARRVRPGDPAIDDAWESVRLVNPEGTLRFSFPDVNGAIVSSSDARFQKKVVLVNIFGTWCPNCHDEAPLLAEWHKEFGPAGLEIVGLAYEFGHDIEHSRRQIRRFAKRYGVNYPILLAGTSEKAKAATTLPDLSSVVAYPTSIFIGRDGMVRAIHTGFSGPGTGAHHDELVNEMRAMLEKLVGERGAP